MSVSAPADGRNDSPIWRIADELAPDFIALSDAVWATPELNFQETRSSAEHARVLREQGFAVTTGLAGLPTSVMGEAGEGGPVIAFLGEFDALPELSQEAGSSAHRPLVEKGAGHGCGHNLLGSASMLAATAVANWLKETGRPGRVRYYGCPAEEGGAGKAFMVADGVFHDVDAAFCWHPSAFSGVMKPLSLASATIDFSFSGKSAHAAMSPHLGRSALDAAEMMSFGVNYMREHIPTAARVHYAYVNAGGIAPNVVQAASTVRYMVRGTDAAMLLPIIEWVKEIAAGAALMSGTTVSSKLLCAMRNLVPNVPLEQAMQRNFARLGGPQFDEADRDFARAIQSTFLPKNIAAALSMFALPDEALPLCERVVGFPEPGRDVVGSTDVGDVSWAVPTVQASGACQAIGTELHTWQVTAQGKSGLAHKGMVHTAKVMAATAADLFEHPELLAAAKRDHAERLAASPPVSLLPAAQTPAFDMSA